MIDVCRIAAVNIRAQVTTQADYVISTLGQVHWQLFVQIKLTEKDVTGA